MKPQSGNSISKSITTFVSLPVFGVGGFFCSVGLVLGWLFFVYYLKPFLLLHFLLLLNFEAINSCLILNKFMSVQCSAPDFPLQFKGVLLCRSVKQTPAHFFTSTSVIAIDSLGVTKSTSWRAPGTMLEVFLSIQVKSKVSALIFKAFLRAVLSHP